ncbi:hypothetical protein IU397_19495 [Actibacterium sp. 188UL27-1]|nr:hypothetical protein [Actibacterium sp. 188UL27-1]
MVRPTEIGSSKIVQFGLSGEFRVFSIPEAIVSSEAMQAPFGCPGRGMLQFDGDIYKGQFTGGEFTALGFTQFVGTHSGVSDDVVYKATKAFWENLEEVNASAFSFKRSLQKPPLRRSMCRCIRRGQVLRRSWHRNSR